MNFISRIIKSINAMRERLKIERHEAMYGPPGVFQTVNHIVAPAAA
jgi:hypothetical protein